MSASVLVTGASRGLGLFLCEAALAADFRVFAGYREAPGALAQLAQRHPRRLGLLQLDVTRPEQVLAARAELEAEVRSLDALVNNAAILPAAGRGPLETLDVGAGLEVFDTNALGPLRVTQAFLGLLRAGTRKLILNVSSEAGSVGDCWRHDEHLYCMSKAALNVQTAIVRNQLAPEGFEVLAVHPGWLRTDMGGPHADLDPREAARALLAFIERKQTASQFFVDYRGAALAC